MTANDVTAEYGTTDDFSTAATGGMAAEVDFADGDTAVNIVYDITEDAVVEGIESFTLTLTLRGTTATSDSAVIGAPYSVAADGMVTPGVATVFIIDCTCK